MYPFSKTAKIRQINKLNTIQGVRRIAEFHAQRLPLHGKVNAIKGEPRVAASYKTKPIYEQLQQTAPQP